MRYILLACVCLLAACKEGEPQAAIVISTNGSEGGTAIVRLCASNVISTAHVFHLDAPLLDSITRGDTVIVQREHNTYGEFYYIVEARPHSARAYRTD